MLKLRDYQQDCIDIIQSKPPGSYLIQMATGLGKTATFSNIPRTGRMLILSHREELVEQPRKYFSCSYGVERAQNRSNGEEVISASVQTMVRRLEKFQPDEFQYVIVDECHHAAAKTYKSILKYFKPEKTLGFTATPCRADSVKLDDVFSEIIFQRDLRWGIENGYLSPIHALRVTLDYSLDGVKTQNGDYAPGELDRRMDGTEDAIAEVYQKHAQGATLIFAASVRHAQEIAKRIPGAQVVTGETKNRAEIIDGMTRGEVPCIVNCMVFTEGTDIPRVETVIMARPTKSESLYCLDEETEILTKAGWKKNVEVGEMVAAFDTETSKVKFLPALATVRRDLEPDEYFCSISGQSCDIRVTNRHRMVYTNRPGKPWRIETADYIADLRDGCRIPVSGHGEFPGVPLTDDELRFIGWVMTDGTINKYNNAISITQSSTQPWVEEIQRVIDACGFKYGRSVRNSRTEFNRNGDNIMWTISKGEPRGRDKHLRGWGALEPWLSKDLNPSLYDMTERQFDVMLEAIHLGDGHKQGGQSWTQRSYHITKGNKTFIERLQMMAVQRGYRASVVEYINSSGNPIWTIHLKKVDAIRVGSKYDSRPKWIKEEHTNEKCWCAENELGTLIIRRNGKVSIVGNCQMVGRGLRLYPGKKELILIDCVDLTQCHSLCTAPSLLGIDLEALPKEAREKMEGDLFELPDLARALSDTPECWIRNVEVVNLWAKQQKYQLHDINFFKMPDGELVVSLLDNTRIRIPPPDALGMVPSRIGPIPMQDAIDMVYKRLQKKYQDQSYLWDKRQMKRWDGSPASDKQKELIRRMCKSYEGVDELSKGQASMILNRLFAGKSKGKRG